jgi:hypothetical protein
MYIKVSVALNEYNHPSSYQPSRLLFPSPAANMKFFYLLSLSMPLLVQATVSTFSQTLCTTKVASKKPSKVSTKSAAATITLRPTVTSSVTNTKTVTPTSS